MLERIIKQEVFSQIYAAYTPKNEEKYSNKTKDFSRNLRTYKIKKKVRENCWKLMLKRHQHVRSRFQLQRRFW
jgi:hypothetical protein